MTCEAWPMTCWTPPEDADLAEVLWEAACDVVWSVTGRRLGICTQSADVSMPYPGDSCLPVPYHGLDGIWRNVTYGFDCCRLTLPVGPVVSVEAVTVDGAAFTGFELSGDSLIRTDAQCWPADRYCGAPRIHVEWTAGAEAPTLAQMAAAEVADELVKACAADPSCRLPSNVINIVRQGVTLSFIDPQVLVDAGLYGMPRLDLAIRTFNPSRLQVASRVFSPDAPRFSRA